MPEVTDLRFTLHNAEHTVRFSDVVPETTLLQYIRDHEHLKGTKFMCLEGGCGACIVSITTIHPITKRTVTFAVNSCLVSIYSCQGWRIQTVDGIGNKHNGYHPIQKVLADYNGTQCGFCSPGMVMNMYALYESNSNLTMEDIDTSFGGNMCRCTGYRPILTAFKTLAKDADEKILGEYPDIEDFSQCKKESCQSGCILNMQCKKFNSPLVYLNASGSKWFKVESINEIFDVLKESPNKTYQLVAGNTGRGVYPNLNGHPQVYIDISSVTNLRNHAVTTNNFIVGANKPLSETIDVFENTAKIDGYSYLQKLADHIKQIAHVPVRNIGTLAGNLTIKQRNNEFPSDIFLIFETVGSKLTIVDITGKEQQYDLVNYLSLNMNKKLIKNIILPKLDKTFRYKSYKITPRVQNAHAMVNAGFLLKLSSTNNVQQARIVYGGINPDFIHATKTEKYIIGKNLFDNKTLQGVFQTLDEELQPDNVLPEPTPKFRKALAISLFYKFVLSIAPDDKISARHKSGGSLLTRPISNGTQDYQTNKSLYPLTQPVTKLEALLQTSGEAPYISDIPYTYDQLYAAFVTAKAPANSVITNIDASNALAYEGVVAFYSAKDIPGPNTFIPLNVNFAVGFIPPSLSVVPEELFCSGTVKYYSQPVGVIVAKSRETAEQAVELVTVRYDKGKEKPLLTIREVVQAGAKNKIFEEARRDATGKGKDVKHVVRGRYDTFGQYHYHMETQVCCVFPNGDELDIYPGTQWMDVIQLSVANLLKINENSINVHVKRLGGAFGAKITRNCLLACATSLAAYKLQKPVRMHMPLTTNMSVIGKRYPAAADYEVGVNDKGEIQYLNTTFYLDYAAGGNEPIVAYAIDVFIKSYKSDTWTVIGNTTRTDNHASVWVRGPGHTNVMAMIETIMEHVAMEINISPLEMRVINISQDEDVKILKYINECREWSDYDNRIKIINDFNKNNRWRKKGLSIVPMTFSIPYIGGFSSTVAIYAGDGTVTVSHGGIECGQGINTKVAQVCAYTLGIPLDMVSIKSSNNLVSANNFLTGGSLTSEVTCYATLRACETLLERMKPIREKLKNPTWKELVKECFKEYVDLVAMHMYSPNDPPKGYDIFSVCVSEVEVDILTGIYQVNRVDLAKDVGRSMSPLIDIGQVEGAFIMGLGFWTMEKPVYDSDGRLLTNRTWNYKIPGARDIPIDFRVKFPKNNPNPYGVLNSKATGEPAICLACSVPIAVRHAIASARLEANSNASKWYPIDGPSDVENTFLNSLNNYKQYTL